MAYLKRARVIGAGTTLACVLPIGQQHQDQTSDVCIKTSLCGQVRWLLVRRCYIEEHPRGDVPKDHSSLAHWATFASDEDSKVSLFDDGTCSFPDGLGPRNRCLGASRGNMLSRTMSYAEQDELPLEEALELVAINLGRPRGSGRRLFLYLPEAFQRLSATRIGRNWFYSLWDGLLRLERSVVLSSNAQRNVISLLRAVEAVVEHLSPADRSKVLAQLGNPNKHQEFMEELVPLTRLPGGAKVEYEVEGEGGKRIEYRICCPNMRPMFLEVKYRYCDIVHFMQQLAASNFTEANVEPPRANQLFRSVVKKFPAGDPSQQLQGVWIAVNVRHGREDLHQAFEALDPARVHFAILATSEDCGYVLGRTPEIGAAAADFFQVTHNPAFVL